MNNEDALKEADYNEAESTCPLCGGKPTRFLERPNECGACWLPVGQWQVIRQILKERDEAMQRPLGDPEIGLEIMRLERDEARKAARSLLIAGLELAVFKKHEVIEAALAKWPWLKETSDG